MNNSTCPNLPFWQPVLDTVAYTVYRVAASLYFVFGLIGHSLLLLALYKQSKKEPAYKYQVYRSLAGTIQVVVRSLYYLTAYVIIPNFANPFPILNSCYAFMWYSAYLGTPMSNAMHTTLLLISIAMLSDRIFALHKPIAYKAFKHKQKSYQIMAITVSISLGFGASTFDCFRNKLIYGDINGTYAIILNSEYMGSNAAYALALCRVALQSISLVVLVTLSILLVLLYRLRFVKGNQTVSNDNEQKRRKEGEKTLTVLAMLECSFNGVGMIFLIVHYVLFYGILKSYACEGLLLEAALLDLTTMIVDLADFYTVFLVSKAFRKMLRNAFHCRNGSVSATANIVRASRNATVAPS